MKTYILQISDNLDKTGPLSPIPLEIFPNNMGINLCSIDYITWQRQSNGQLVNLQIYFIPNEN